MEEMAAKGKERWVWQAVVLKDNCLFDLLKNPTQATRHSLLAAKIFIGKILQHSAWPIDLLYDASDFFTKVLFVFIPRTVRND